ncbi:coatomer epsilon subunit-domain-containing protein [Syncephalis plumigaleata]|nr:coatomer epsilon subunit-domain-containing protein [Syncephalis plumigaleata]
MSAETLTKLRDLYYLGCFSEVHDQAKSYLNEDRNSIVVQEINTIYYRVLLALRRADEAVDALKERAKQESNTGVFSAALLLARYVQAQRADREDTATKLVDEALALAAKDSNNGGSDDEPALDGITTVLIGQLLLAARKPTEAVTLLKKHPRNIECATLAIQGYLMMGRADIAQQEVEATKEWSDDALPLQLAEAWVNLSAGGDRCQSTAYIFDELGINAAISANSLCGQAACNLMMQRYPEAESLLLEAQSSDAKNPDVLADLMVAHYLTGNTTDAETCLSELEQAHSSHPLIQNRLEKSALFDTAAAAYTV